MEQVAFNGMLIIGIGTLLTIVVAIITPILKLNSSITKLNVNFDNMIRNDANRDRRIDAHSKEIDELYELHKGHDTTLMVHGVKIEDLERRIEKDCGS